jgi:uncharacterized protein YecE (DUF72 family)
MITAMTRNFIGTSGWSYDHWVGRFYPGDLNRREWLEFYTKSFDSVELNASFYRLPKKETFRNWRTITPPGFRLSVKMSRYVTHVKKLLSAEESLGIFFDAVSGLGDKCSAVLIQLPPSLKFDPERTDKLLHELKGNYDEYRFTMECRNQSWFNKEVYDLFEEYGVAFCISDTPCYPYTEVVTADFVYVRLHGHEQLYASNYGDEQLGEWANRIKEWNDEDRDVYVYFDNDANAYAIENALKLNEYLGD